LPCGLAPADDIVPALTTAGVESDFRLAMSLGAAGRDAFSVDEALRFMSDAGRHGSLA